MRYVTLGETPHPARQLVGPLPTPHPLRPQAVLLLLLLSLLPSALGATFSATNLAVVRVGSGTAVAATVAQAVFVDEYTTSGTLVQSVPVVATSGTANACTLSGGPSSTTWLYDQEGIPSLSTTNEFLVFPCYSVAVAGTLINSGSKVAAIVSYTAGVSTSTTSVLSTAVGNTNFPTALRTTVSNGVGVWWAQQNPTTMFSTMQYSVLFSTTSTDMCDFVVGKSIGSCVWGG